MNLVENTGEIVQEPDWSSLFDDVLEVNAAHEHWRIVTTELRERSLLSPSTGHAIQRLITAYVMYDRASREVAENGSVIKPKRGSTRAITRLSPHFSAMRESNADAMTLEAELGLSPRRRASAGKIDRRTKAVRPADAYLKSVTR